MPRFPRLPLFANPLVLLEHVQVVFDHREGNLRHEGDNGERCRIKPKRVWHGKNAGVRLGKEVPCQESFPPAMEPIEVADVVGEKDGRGLNRVFDLFGI
jgi:hypothetical protein